jgi:hypothetical protein
MSKSAISAPFIANDVQNILVQNGRAIADMCAEPVLGNSTCTIGDQAGIAEQLTALNSVVNLLNVRGEEDDDAQQNGKDDSDGGGDTGRESQGIKEPSSSVLVSMIGIFLALFSNIP